MIEEVNKTHTCTHSLNRYFVVIKAADDEIGLQAISRGGNVKSRSHHLLLRGVLLAVCNSSLSKVNASIVRLFKKLLCVVKLKRNTLLIVYVSFAPVPEFGYYVWDSPVAPPKGTKCKRRLPLDKSQSSDVVKSGSDGGHHRVVECRACKGHSSRVVRVERNLRDIRASHLKKNCLAARAPSTIKEGERHAVCGSIHAVKDDCDLLLAVLALRPSVILSNRKAHRVATPRNAVSGEDVLDFDGACDFKCFTHLSTEQAQDVGSVLLKEVHNVRNVALVRPPP
eukprot:XP_001707669.1 Hypothetical protein GL50803_17440 [Giardia lamblia ATCC 50803]